MHVRQYPSIFFDQRDARTSESYPVPSTGFIRIGMAGTVDRRLLLSVDLQECLAARCAVPSSPLIFPFNRCGAPGVLLKRRLNGIKGLYVICFWRHFLLHFPHIIHICSCCSTTRSSRVLSRIQDGARNGAGR
jgi:hypothetical protein